MPTFSALIQKMPGNMNSVKISSVKISSRNGDRAYKDHEWVSHHSISRAMNRVAPNEKERGSAFANRGGGIEIHALMECM